MVTESGMALDFRVEYGLEDPDDVLSLLQTAYDHWGDEALFGWRYRDDPTFDPNDAVSIYQDEELVAFRRLYRRELVTASEKSYGTVILGDTCVAPAHQGQGFYSELHDSTMQIESPEREVSCTFNTAGSVTHKANLNRGWSSRGLPIWIRMLNAQAALPYLARQAIESGSILDRVLSRIGPSVALKIDDARIGCDALVGHSPTDGDARVTIPIPNVVLSPALEIAANHHRIGALRRRWRLGFDQQDITDRTRYTARAEDPPISDGDTVEELQSLLGRNRRGSLRFERSPAALRHMLDHPHLTGLILVYRRGELRGAAPVVVRPGGAIQEARVLDLVGDSPTARRVVLNRATSHAAGAGADLAIVLQEADPGKEWIRVDRQRFMWIPHDGDGVDIDRGDIAFGMYDVL